MNQPSPDPVTFLLGHSEPAGLLLGKASSGRTLELGLVPLLPREAVVDVKFTKDQSKKRR